MWVADGGSKWNGLAVNGQFFARWVSNFEADGPLPLASTFDRGGEASASYFVKPKKLMPYVRGSWVRGQFGNSYEYGGGGKRDFLPAEGIWLKAERFRGGKAPYRRTFSPATARMTGLGAELAGVLAFFRSS